MHGPGRVPASLPLMPAQLASFKVAIDESPLLPGTRPIELRYQEGGRGAPMVLLHGGWGYGFYPHDDAVAKLDRRFLIPDRTSDGAIIATILALRHPERYDGIIVEAIHLDREKPRSRDFFLQMQSDPDAFGERVTRKLAEEHGEDYWRTIIRTAGRAWVDIAATPK